MKTKAKQQELDYQQIYENTIDTLKNYSAEDIAKVYFYENMLLETKIRKEQKKRENTSSLITGALGTTLAFVWYGFVLNSFGVLNYPALTLGVLGADAILCAGVIRNSRKLTASYQDEEASMARMAGMEEAYQAKTSVMEDEITDIIDYEASYR